MKPGYNKVEAQRSQLTWKKPVISFPTPSPLSQIGETRTINLGSAPVDCICLGEHEL